MLSQDEIAHLSRWVGRGEERSETLSAELVARFRATFDMVEPVDGALPMLLHLCLAQPVAPTAALAADGHPARGGFLPPVPLPRRMWAGGAFTFHAPMTVGARIRRLSRIEAVTVKHGRSGELCFVTVRHEIESDGQPTLTERQDIVYRPAETARLPPASPAAPPAADSAEAKASFGPALQRRRIIPSEALLFRYSALTFNAHRIHYDHPYATGPEGYSGLVVHGPMQATLLCQYAADLAGAPPARFSFRSTAPILGTEPFDLCADFGEGRAQLWTGRPGSAAARLAEAEW